MGRKRIGDLLVERKVISVQQLEAGLLAQKQTGLRLGATLLQMGAITEIQLAITLAQSLGLPSVDLARAQVDWSAVHMLRARFCETHEVFPFGIEGKGTPNKKLMVAMVDPLNRNAVEEIEFTTGLVVSIRVATQSHVRAAILRYYHKVSPDGSSKISSGSAIRYSPISTADQEPIIDGEELPPEAPAPIDAAVGTTGVFNRLLSKGKAGTSVAKDLDYLFGTTGEEAPVEKLERKFWLLLRILARKGVISREELLQEFERDE